MDNAALSALRLYWRHDGVAKRPVRVKLTPSFTPGVTLYTARVRSCVDRVDVDAVPDDLHATCVVRGAAELSRVVVSCCARGTASITAIAAQVFPMLM